MNKTPDVGTGEKQDVLDIVNELVPQLQALSKTVAGNSRTPAPQMWKKWNNWDNWDNINDPWEKIGG